MRPCPWRIADRAVVAYQEWVASAPDSLTLARAELQQHVEDVWQRYQQEPPPKSTPGRRGGVVYRGPGPLRMGILVLEGEVVEVTSVETATNTQRNQRRAAQRRRRA